MRIKASIGSPCEECSFRLSPQFLLSFAVGPDVRGGGDGRQDKDLESLALDAACSDYCTACVCNARRYQPRSRIGAPMTVLELRKVCSSKRRDAPRDFDRPCHKARANRLQRAAMSVSVLLFAAGLHVRLGVGNEGQTGLIVLDVNLFESDPYATSARPF